MNDPQVSVVMPSCTVVVCTRDRPESLDRCLDVIFKQIYSPADVLVIDNSPRDSRTRALAGRWDVRYIVEPVPGLSRARNRGARACKTDIIAFTDDDALPEPGWLSGLVKGFEDPLVMATTGRVLPLNIETEAERLFADAGGFGFGGPDHRVIDRRQPLWFELANFGGIGSGGNMAFRRQAFEVWPGFDERLGRGATLRGFEEYYAFFSLIDRGYRLVYTPDAIVRHPFPRSMRDLRTRYIEDLTAAAAYMAFLFVENPLYRPTLLKYALDALRGMPRTWRGLKINSRSRIVSRWRRLLAYLYGPGLYVMTLLAPKIPRSKLIENDLA